MSFTWTPLTEVDRAARHNIEELRNLFCQLKRAVHDANLDTAAVADQIGVDEDAARDLLDGVVDLTMSDLEVLLVAVQARLDVKITSIHGAEPQRQVRRDIVAHQWRDAPRMSQDAATPTPPVNWLPVPV